MYQTIEDMNAGQLLSLLVREGQGELLMDRFKSLKGLAAVSMKELQDAGLTRIGALKVLAAIQLAVRYAGEPEERAKISCPIDCVLLMKDMCYLDREHFRAILLNTKNMVIKTVKVSVGTLDSSLAHPRECFKEAVRSGAASIIFTHNHPSQDPEPSRQDLELTKRLKECGELLGITVLDHIIVGTPQRWVSLRERNAM